ncbi:MAG: SelT/SelW/SelH family protein [Gemmatimonadetes bacterium]|nr:SelT/SelW/SelH family protein [Gemmatimonadota bacterium]
MAQAVGLAAEILKAKKMDLEQLVILPSSGGRFEVSVDGELIFSKVAEGRFPENEEILAQI